jgi:hypothetical protein
MQSTEPSDEEQQMDIRIGVLAVSRMWVELNYDAARVSAEWQKAVSTFIAAAFTSPHANLKLAAWDLIRAMSANTVGAQELRNVLDAMQAKETAIEMHLQLGRKPHFTWGELLDWLKRWAGVGEDGAACIGEELSRAWYIRVSPPTSALLPAAPPDVHMRGRRGTAINPLSECTYLTIVRAPKVELMEGLPLAEHTPADLAAQLCVREQILFRAIKLDEFLGCAWSKASLKKTTSPNILAMIKHSNRVSYWIATEIVSGANVKARLEALRRAITIGTTCLKYGCFSAVTEILAGLQHSVVRKLRSTWSALPFKYRDQLRELLELMSPADNFAQYRAAIRAKLEAGEPCVPHLGQYLTDITFVDQNRGKVRGLINFRKMSMLAAIFAEIFTFQKLSYGTSPSGSLLAPMSPSPPSSSPSSSSSLTLSIASSPSVGSLSSQQQLPPLVYKEEIQRLLVSSNLGAAQDDEQLAAMAKEIESEEKSSGLGDRL